MAVEVRAELAVGDAGLDSHCVGPAVERHNPMHRFQRQQVVTAIRNGVETVASAEHFHFVQRSQQGPKLRLRSGLAQALRAVGQIARPVGQLLLVRPGGEGSDDGARDAGREQVEESSFVHGRFVKDDIRSVRVGGAGRRRVLNRLLPPVLPTKPPAGCSYKFSVILSSGWFGSSGTR